MGKMATRLQYIYMHQCEQNRKFNMNFEQDVRNILISLALGTFQIPFKLPQRLKEFAK